MDNEPYRAPTTPRVIVYDGLVYMTPAGFEPLGVNSTTGEVLAGNESEIRVCRVVGRMPSADREVGRE
jgi:hypothetical protein